MIQSMTGFGKVTAELPSKKVTVEIKSLNSKQFDLNARISPVYREKEIQIRNELLQILERGKIEFAIYIENIGKDTAARINLPVVESYFEQIGTLSKHLHIAEPSDWYQALLRMPDVIRNEVTEADESEWATIHDAIREATRHLISFRIQEGVMLQKLFEEKIAKIADLLTRIDRYENERIEKIKNRILENLKNINEVEYDKHRFEQELIYYIEKLDVNEEKARLDNHLKYFIDTLNQGRGQGKKLGFIAQEIGREINTLGSKSNHAEMQQIVVQMKDELEQIKEQVLNVL
ncbi:MAG: YicC family protein [Tannerella sp.]|nr:YicC family protein [Tannerella sp.]